MGGVGSVVREHETSVAPAGFARVLALTEEVEVQYKCTAIYSSKAESAIRWDDPGIGIDWPQKDVLLSGQGPGSRHADGLVSVAEFEAFPLRPTG